MHVPTARTRQGLGDAPRSWSAKRAVTRSSGSPHYFFRTYSEERTTARHGSRLMVHRYLAYAGYLLVGGTAIKAAQVLGGDKDARTVDLADQVPTRQYQLSSLKKSTSERPFDLLIVGGGATGAGVAVDAATRYASRCTPPTAGNA
jgi:hypothetical protein